MSRTARAGATGEPSDQHVDRARMNDLIISITLITNP